MMAMAREQPLPVDTEARLADFTELVATALANAENQAQLTASRARIVAAADQARRRIERDLHDGAQQRLVSLGLHLRAAQAAMPPEAIELAARLEGLADEVTTALDELRELARGIHPAALAQGGLGPALKGLARRSAVPVKLDVRVVGRLPEQFETAAYYVVSEALTNAAKHAHASVVHVGADTVEDDGDGVLRVRVTDDGRGGAHFAGGSGLVGLKDRVEALGGTLTIKSPPGEGTALHATVPIDGPASNHGASSARLTVKIPPTALQFHVPSPLLSTGSARGPGQPSGPPGWLHDIAASRPVFSAAVENCCELASNVVSVIRCACVSARITWLVTKRPCSATSS